MKKYYHALSFGHFVQEEKIIILPKHWPLIVFYDEELQKECILNQLEIDLDPVSFEDHPCPIVREYAKSLIR
ncbi:MAG: hypothetical protein MJY98_11075 [Fibrobacter sp.]|nr:hypothetical protein [Fibrobacter sp.]